MKHRTANLVIVSDLHAGCRMGLCPPGPIPLDDGGTYHYSPLQAQLWRWWLAFWAWVPRITHGEPYSVLVNGDSVDGVHHNSTTQISHNLSDQARIAHAILAPVAKRARRFYMVRGTEAHVGPSGVEEERLAEALGAVPNTAGQFARHELWIQVGTWLVHCAHHVGTTGRTHYESSAPMGELAEAYADAGRWGRRPPDCVVRSHRHRHIKVDVAAARGSNLSVVTPGWQLKTPYAYRIAGGRSSQPQLGGIIIRQGDEEPHERHWVRSLTPPKPERLA